MSDDKPTYDSSMQTLRSVLAQTLHEVDARHEGVSPLKGHPGKSIDIYSRGLPRFREKMVKLSGDMPTAEMMSSLAAQHTKAMALCESPIERNLLAALVTGNWPRCESHAMVHNAKDYGEPFPRCPIVLVPQMAILRFRLDIGVVATRYDGAVTLFGIECDGKEFHQDGEKDRERDAYLFAVGVRVVRVTGRILNEAPIEMADALISVIDGALK